MGTCASSSCTDGVKNDGETGVDCGGPSNGTVCGACTGGACTANSGCANSELCTNSVCTIPTSCATVPATTNGVYTIKPNTTATGTAYKVYCDFTTVSPDGTKGPWTLIAKIGVHNSENQGTPALWNYNDALWTDATTTLNTTDVTLNVGRCEVPGVQRSSGHRASWRPRRKHHFLLGRGRFGAGGIRQHRHGDAGR